MLLLVTAALAHVPHSVLAGAVVGDPGAPWWVLYNGGESSVLYRSDDAGHRWAAVPAAPTVDDTRRITRLDDGTLLLLASHRLWWSPDGADWSVVDLAAEATAIAAAGDRVLVHTSTGTWSGPPDGLSFTPGAVTAVGGGAALLFTTEAGELHADDAVLDLPLPAVDVVSLLGVKAHGSGGALDVYVGAGDGTAWRHDGTWIPCGALDVDPAHPEVAALASAPDGRVYALVADGRLFRSDDRCAAWIREDPPFHVDFGGGGGAADVAEAVGSLVVTDTDVVLAGWDGLVRGPDWAQERVLPPDYIRGAAVGPDGAVYLASLGGVLRSFDGGASWDAPHRGALDSNVQRVVVDPADPAAVWAIINHVLHHSSDHGADWDEVETGMSSVQEVWVTDVPWAAGDGDLAWYDGSTWTVVASDIRHAWVDGDAVCVSDVVETACTTDRGASWTASGEAGLLVAAGPVGVREDAVIVDGGVVLEAGEDAFRNLVRTDDGTWTLSARSGRLWRSADGVDWEVLPVQLPAAPNLLVAAGSDLILATYDGAFLLRDGEVSPFGRFQPVVGASGFDDCDGCTVLEDACAWSDHLTRVRGSVAVDLRGDRIRVDGLDGTATWTVDGVAVDGDEAAVADGWHEVRLVGSFRFGVIVGASPGATLPLGLPVPPDDCTAPPPTEPTGCGCGGGSAGGLVFGAPLLLGLRRRRIPW